MGNSTSLDECLLSSHRRTKQPAKRGIRADRSLLLAISVAVMFSSLPSQTDAQATPSLPHGADSSVQLVQPAEPGQAVPPITVTLHDALERARNNDSQFLAAVGDAKSAHEDRLQSRNAMLPTASYTTQYLGTQGNGKTPEGRYVTNDGVHVYRAWGVLKQDLSPSTYMLTGYNRASAAEALANAKAEIARRGLTVTVTTLYYELAVSQRKYSTAQQALEQAKHFFNITQAAENVGQTSHSDVVKAEIQYRQQEQAFDEAGLAMEVARLNLAVLLFPTLNENFTIVDDLDSATALPTFAEVEGMAKRENPDLRVAMEAQREADLDVSAAKGAFLPSISLEADYGIEANDFALHAIAKAHPELGPLPTLGYFVTASLTVPVWDWGTLRSKLHQTEFKQQQARVELGRAQRQMLSNLYAFYDEAATSRSAVETTRHTADLAAQSQRLINLRYQAGESSALEVVDAETTLTTARNAYDDAEVRYRATLANLQTLTGSF